MSDDKQAVDAAAVQRAVQSAQLIAYSRRSTTTLGVEQAQNLARVFLALNSVATAAADVFAAREKLLATDPDKRFPAAAEAEAALAEAERSLAAPLLALGFIHIPNQEATNGR